jgi:hypothetical protein
VSDAGFFFEPQRLLCHVLLSEELLLFGLQICVQTTNIYIYLQSIHVLQLDWHRQAQREESYPGVTPRHS